MKTLSKVNRGLILTIVVILGVAAYLVGVSLSQAGDREEIKKVCAQYIQTELQYRMLPEANRKEDPGISQTDLTAYIDKAKAEIKSHYVDNEICYKYLLEEIETSLKQQAKGQGVVYSYEKDVRSYTDFVFDKDSASVVVTCNTSYNGPDRYSMSQSTVKKNTVTKDQMTLQKVDGKWKVTYSYLESYDPYNG